MTRGEWLRRDLTVERASMIRVARWRHAKPRRNDAEWRTEVMALRGNACRVPGCELWPIEADHLIPRQKGGDGPSVAENGLPLCREHHRQKTAHQLLIEQAWLDWDQVEWLREQGYAWWEPDGSVAGPRCGIFAPLVVA